MKVLKLNCKQINEDLLLNLDNLIIDNPISGFSYNIDMDNKELIFQTDDVNNKSTLLTFKDYILPGKFLKEWLINNAVISDPKDNSLFSMVEIKTDDVINTINNNKIDGLIYKVPDDDPKLKSVLQKLSTIKKSKLF